MKTDKKTWSLIISLSCGLYWLAHSTVRPMIALYAHSMGALEWEIGVLLGIYALFPFFLAIPIGGIVNSFDKIKLLRFGSWLMIASGLLYLLPASFWTLLIAQVVAGIGQLFVWLIFQVLITNGNNEAKHSRIATFSLFMALGQLLGPLLGGILSDTLGYVSTFIMYSLICIVLTIVSYLLSEEQETVKKAIPHPSVMYKESKDLLKNYGFMAAILFSFIVLFIIDARMSFLPIYMETLDFSNTVIGLLLSIASLSALLIKPVYPFLVKKLGYQKLLVVSFSFSILLLFAAPVSSEYISMGILIFISGLALSINQPLSLSLISDQTREEQRGIAFGMRLMANRGAQLIDPVVFGTISSLFALRYAFWIVGIFLTLLSFFSMFLFTMANKQQAESLPASLAAKQQRPQI